MWSKYPICAPTNLQRHHVCPGLANRTIPAARAAERWPRRRPTKSQDSSTPPFMQSPFHSCFSAQIGYFDHLLRITHFTTPYLSAFSISETLLLVMAALNRSQTHDERGRKPTVHPVPLHRSGTETHVILAASIPSDCPLHRFYLWVYLIVNYLRINPNMFPI